MTTAHDRLTSYIGATGWREPVEPGPTGGLWRHPESDLLLPVPHDLAEDGLDWNRLIERLARVEDRTTAEVSRRIELLLVDVANIGAANDIVINDTIPYAAGVTMVRESWTMVRSAATTSLGPKAHLRGRYRPRAEEAIERARMAHTKRGSFIIPIYLPLPEPAKAEKIEATIPGTEFREVPESTERRIMRTFAEALAAVDELAIQPEKEPTSQAVHDLTRAGVSHEFTAALHRILREESVAQFSTSFEWAAAAGPAPTAPERVTIPAAAGDRVKRVAQRMRTEAPTRRTEYLTGPIVSISRDEETQAGRVTVQVSRNARLANVTVNVSADRLEEALDWMKAHETVYVESRVHRDTHGLMAEKRDAVVSMKSQHLGG